MSDSVRTIAILAAHPGKSEELIKLLQGMVYPSRSEAGNLRYDLWRDQNDPNRFLLDELYVDSRAVEAHRATSHFQNYLSQVNELADRSLMIVEPVNVS